MKESRRLLETEPEGLSRHLLEFGAREKPSSSGRQKILAAAVTAAGVAATSSVAAGVSSAGILSKIGWGPLLAWLGVGVMATSGVVIALHATKSSSPSHGVSTTVIAAQSAVAQSTSEPPSLSAAPVETENPPPAPEPPQPAIAAAPSSNRGSGVESSGAGGRPTDPDTLAREVAQLDQARKALASGDPDKALKELDARDRAAGKGTMAHEAQVLRIEALLRKGDRKGAAALAEQFLKANKTSPYAPRVRSLLAAAKG